MEIHWRMAGGKKDGEQESAVLPSAKLTEEEEGGEFRSLNCSPGLGCTLITGAQDVLVLRGQGWRSRSRSRPSSPS